MTPHIVVENLNVYYGESHALKNINLTIPDKKITAIIGPSGCGKTTLLKCFNRLIDTYDSVTVSGKLLVDGENIFDKDTEITHIRKKMGLVSQRPFPLPMSIFDNVAYGMKIHGESDKTKIKAAVEESLRSVSLWEEVKDRLNAPASRLSIGQQQRLCLARGLAVEPQIILGDEPTSALDPVSSKHIEEKFVELKEKYTLIIVTHSLSQARRIADHIVFMYLGEIVEHGTTAEILDNPKLERTKEYVFGKIS
jgi:phosphate transport system ATP-binding protein